MSKLHQCDRCATTEPFVNRNCDELPAGWETLIGTDLCDRCSREMHEFLRPLPKVRAEEPTR